MVSHHTFISSSCLLLCEFSRELGLPFFLLTGHRSPLERSIDVLLYQSVLLHFVQLKRGNPRTIRVVRFSCGPWVAEHVIRSPTFLLLTLTWMRLSFSPYCRRVTFPTHPSIWLSVIMWWMNSSCADRPHDLENHLERIWLGSWSSSVTFWPV